MSVPYITIGNVRIKRTAALAPMASVADRAYRYVCKDHGAAYMVSEMISAKGLCYSDRNTEELCTVTDHERPYALQLFGEDPEYIGKAAGMLMKYSPDIIDINMGCPVPKIVKSGAGSALMKDPEQIYRIVRAAVGSCGVPVTVKIRSGWDGEHINAVEAAKAAESAGASAVAVHARTRTQMYSGKADISVITAVKQSVSIPVIGNGDVVSAETARDMYEKTGCDLVMIGRGSYGRPFVFDEIDCFFEGREYAPPTDIERLDVMYHQAELSVGFFGEHTAMSRCRRQCAFYLRGMPDAACFRDRCSRLEKLSQLGQLIDEIKERLWISSERKKNT